MRYFSTIGDQEFEIEIVDENQLILNGENQTIDFNDISGQPIISLLVEGHSHEAFVYPAEDVWHVYLRGRLYTVRVEDEREKMFRDSTGEGVGARSEFHLKAPMPGLVIDVQVEEGQVVDVGDVLVVLESMKMQNELKSPQAGNIARLRVTPGDSVEQNETMLSVI